MKQSLSEKNEHLKKLFAAGLALKQWKQQYELTDDDIKDVLASLWPHLAPGYQQRQAGSVTTSKKAASSAANGKLGGRPRKKPAA